MHKKNTYTLLLAIITILLPQYPIEGISKIKTQKKSNVMWLCVGTGIAATTIGVYIAYRHLHRKKSILVSTGLPSTVDTALLSKKPIPTTTKSPDTIVIPPVTALPNIDSTPFKKTTLADLLPTECRSRPDPVLQGEDFEVEVKIIGSKRYLFFNIKTKDDCPGWYLKKLICQKIVARELEQASALLTLIRAGKQLNDDQSLKEQGLSKDVNKITAWFKPNATPLEVDSADLNLD